MNYRSSQSIIQYLTAVVCRLITANKEQETTAKVIRRCIQVVIPSANLLLCNGFLHMPKHKHQYTNSVAGILLSPISHKS
jgi:hypothetical protein